MEKVILYFALKYKGDWNKVYHALEVHEKIEGRDFLLAIQEVKCKWTTIISEDYMPQLREGFKPPFVLFYKGDLNILKFKENKEIISILDPNRHGSLEGTTKTKDGVKSFEILNKGLLNHLQEVEHSSSDLIMSETYDSLAIKTDDLVPLEQLKIAAAISNTFIISKYDEKTTLFLREHVMRNKYHNQLLMKVGAIEDEEEME